MKSNKIQSYLIAVFACSMLIACSNETEPKSEITQHKVVAAAPLDGPKKQVYVNTSPIEVEKEEQLNIDPKTHFDVTDKLVNKSPNKTLSSLEESIKAMEMEGVYDSNAGNLYYNYADALVDDEQFAEAVLAYNKAKKRNYKDLGNLYLKLAKIHSMKKDNFKATKKYLRKAKEEGFNNYRSLLYAKEFVNFREDSYRFLDLYDEFFHDDKKAMFKAFAYYAPRKKMTKDYVVGPVALFENTKYDYREKTKYYDKHPSINGYFGAFADGVDEAMFSREGGDDFRYEMKLDKDRAYVAIIYTEEEEWADYLLPKTYHLVTFDKIGNKISELEIAKRGSLSKCKGVVFHPDNSLEVTKYKIGWKKGRKSKRENNDEHLMQEDLDFAEAQSTTYYMINAAGKIVETEGMGIGMN